MATFSKVSRYRALDDVTVVHGAGHARLSKALRLAAPVTGKFQHRLEDSDRADQLAYKYYKQPRRWWRIADANPQFLSLQELLGQDAVVIARFPVTFTSTPPWSAMLASIAARTGVEAALLEEEWLLVPETQVVDGQEVTVTSEHVHHAVRVTYNRLNVEPGELADAIAAFGFDVSAPEINSRVGKPIVIPPDTAGLRG